MIWFISDLLLHNNGQNKSGYDLDVWMQPCGLSVQFRALHYSVCVWVPELSHAAHRLGNTATWPACLWASSFSSQMHTTPSHSTAPPAGSYCNQLAAWILYTRASWRKGPMEDLGKGMEKNAEVPRSHRNPFCGTDSPVCPLPAPPESP